MKVYGDMSPQERLDYRVKTNRAIEARVAPVLQAKEAAAHGRTGRQIVRLARQLDNSLRKETGEGLPVNIFTTLIRKET